MLIKTADDKSAYLAELELAMRGSGPDAKIAKDLFYKTRAGIKGEKDSAYFIDFHYGSSSKNWAVIHDLRLEHGGRVAQIDHVLISRLMEVYAVETKHFNDGIKITDEGEFLRWDSFRKTYIGMESPIAQNERHVAVLRDVFKTLPLPERLGIRLQPSFSSYVLVSNNAKILRPKGYDSSQVIKADLLKARIDHELDNPSAIKAISSVARLVSSDTVKQIATALARLHKPRADHFTVSMPIQTGKSPSKSEATKPTVIVSQQKTLPQPTCKSCKSSAGEILYGKFGYYFKCSSCGGNTGIRFGCLPGHKPKVRKSGNVFYRDCAECGSSDPFHVNPT